MRGFNAWFIDSAGQVSGTSPCCIPIYPIYLATAYLCDHRLVCIYATVCMYAHSTDPAKRGG